LKETEEKKKRKEAGPAAEAAPEAAEEAGKDLRESAPDVGRPEEADTGAERPEGAEPETGSPEEPQEVRLAREVEQWQEKHLRLLADFENYKKRAAREKADLVQYGNEGLLKDLLPVIDNMERVLAYSMQEGDWKDFQRGVELVISEIHKTLAGHGVQPLQVLGADFDPTLHAAMQRVETEQAPANTVVEEFQKGYLFRDRLLRPALVAVAAPVPAAGHAEGRDDAGEGAGPGPGAEGQAGGGEKVS